MTEPVTVLFIGDPHFKVANVHETDAMVEAILRVANQKRPDIIVVLGDVLDRHEIVHVSPLTRAVDFLGRLMTIAPTYVLIGNHDLKNNRQFLSDEHPFPSLKYWGPNMTVVDTTKMAVIKGHTFVFVPYTPPGRLVEALDLVNTEGRSWKEATCICAHQEIRNCQMGAIVSTEGDEWPLTNPYLISGHIHDYHELQPNMVYTGTPIQHSFGDRHDKTISYITFRSSHDRDHERIDLGLPRKQIVRLTCDEVSSYVPQTNSLLKIIISGTSGEIKAIMKHPNVDAWKKAGYKIMYKDIPTEAIKQELIPMKGAPLRFSVAFYNSVKSNPRLNMAHNRIFGPVEKVRPTLIIKLA